MQEKREKKKIKKHGDEDNEEFSRTNSYTLQLTV